MHWYVYHSQKTMGYAYAKLDAPTAFSTKNQRKLCHGDTVWVIEGDLSSPTNYAIADCFVVQSTDTSPFRGNHLQFKLKVTGERSLIRGPVALDKSTLWFSELRERFITKQRFFCTLEDHQNIQDGLVAASGVAI